VVLVTADVPPESVELGPRSLGEKVEWLIQHMWPTDQPHPKTNNDVARAITAVTGEDVSGTSVWKLRTGRSANPTLKTLTALATFFKVPIGYFGEDEKSESIADQVALLALMREEGISSVALRSLANLSVGGRQVISDMIETIARRERHDSGGASGSGD
jgi:transcriptional regulator with XRE-family HTH domain